MFHFYYVGFHFVFCLSYLIKCFRSLSPNKIFLYCFLFLSPADLCSPFSNGAMFISCSLLQSGGIFRAAVSVQSGVVFASRLGIMFRMFHSVLVGFVIRSSFQLLLNFTDRAMFNSTKLTRKGKGYC